MWACEPTNEQDGGDRVMTQNSIALLVDVDDALLENDHIQDDLKRHIEFGTECRDRFWAIREELFNELGYRDYLAALQGFRAEHPYEFHLTSARGRVLSANRLYPGALDVLEKFRAWADGHPFRWRRGVPSRAKSNAPASSRR
jgi:hypothetical protein